MNSATYPSELRRVKSSAAGLVIQLHQSGYNYDFSAQERNLLCIQNNRCYCYDDVEIDCQTEYFDETSYIYKFIYTVKTSCGVNGILITEKDNLNTIKGAANGLSLSAYLINGLDPITYNLVLGIINRRKRGEDRLLIKYRDKILAISLTETALFYLEHKLTKLVMYDGRSYIVQKTMDEIEKQSGMSFFRVNRQFIVNKYAIKELTSSLNRTISVSLKVDFPLAISVSKNRSCNFLEWFALNF